MKNTQPLFCCQKQTPILIYEKVTYVHQDRENPRQPFFSEKYTTFFPQNEFIFFSSLAVTIFSLKGFFFTQNSQNEFFQFNLSFFVVVPSEFLLTIWISTGAQKIKNPSSFLQAGIFTHSFFDCVPSEIERQVRISPSDCEQVRDTATFSTAEMRIENININEPVNHFWYSYGQRDENANCKVTDFSRNGIHYRNSYEKSRQNLPLQATPEKQNPA